MKEKTYNYFYIVVNLKNGHFYHGIHSTDNMDDGYMGSGTVLQAAFDKHKKDNFVLIPLVFFPTRTELEAFEAHVVNKEFLRKYRGVCYNVAEGGHGGDLSAGKSDEEKAIKNQKISDSWADPEAKQQRVENIKKSLEDPERREMISEKKTEYWSDPDRREDMSKKQKEKYADPAMRKKISDSLKGNPKLRTQLGKKPWNAGKHHSEETRNKISKSNSGENNPMFGKPSAIKGKKRQYREDGSYYYA